MRNDSSRLFWVSYADLMTALFIVMLTLFVFAYKMFIIYQDDAKKSNYQLKLRNEELEKQAIALNELRDRLSEEELLAGQLIAELNDERARLAVMEAEYLRLKAIEEAIERLDKKYFTYQPEYKRHVLRSNVQFASGKANISSSYHSMLKNAGLALQRLVQSLQQDENINYLLVIEGMASKDNYSRNYELSYERALALHDLWATQGIRFDPSKVEVIISGSGTGGVGRDENQEAKNQRFLIQIIPKIGELQDIAPKDSISVDDGLAE